MCTLIATKQLLFKRNDFTFFFFMFKLSKLKKYFPIFFFFLIVIVSSLLCAYTYIAFFRHIRLYLCIIYDWKNNFVSCFLVDELRKRLYYLTTKLTSYDIQICIVDLAFSCCCFGLYITVLFLQQMFILHWMFSVMYWQIKWLNDSNACWKYVTSKRIDLSKRKTYLVFFFFFFCSLNAKSDWLIMNESEQSIRHFGQKRWKSSFFSLQFIMFLYALIILWNINLSFSSSFA